MDQSKQLEVISAVQSGDVENLRRLITADRSLASARDASGVSALMHALYGRRPNIAELLLSSGPALDIFEATAAGKADRVCEILDEDPDVVKSWSADGFTALHFAAFFRKEEIARTLIRRGCDPAACSRNAMRVTPLHSAAAAASSDIVRLLLEAGSPVNERQQGGWTALHAAAENGDKEMVKTLLEHGADPLIASDEGKTPSQLAQAKGYEEILRVLSQ